MKITTKYSARGWLRLSAITVLGLTGAATAAAQTPPAPNPEQAKTVPVSVPSKSVPNIAASVPVYSNYKGVALGMSTETVRDTLGKLKEKGAQQDYFVFSERETAQVYYDDKGLVKAVSVDYLGTGSEVPSPTAVVGETPVAKPDGSIYVRKDYPAVGYWVSYSRTAGKDPIVSVTMQRMWN